MIRSRASAVGADFGDYISTKVLNAGEAAVAGPDSDGKSLVALIEENGYRLTQLCLHAIGPGEVKDCELLTGVDVCVVEGDLPTLVSSPSDLEKAKRAASPAELS